MRYEDGNVRLNRDLDDTILDIRDSVEKNDYHLAGDLIPRGYRVRIDPPLGRPYYLDSDEFYSLYSDMVSTTKTRHFDITDVQEGRDWAQVYVRHTFDDPWNRSNTTYMRYTLELAGGHYRIAEFATSRRSL